MKARKTKPQSRQNKKPAGFSLDPSLVNEVKAIADKDDRSVSYIAEMALREYVERRKNAAA